MKTISRHCPQCQKYSVIEAKEKTFLKCEHCSKEWGRVDSLDSIFDRCFVCNNRQFHRTRDFHPVVGLGIMFLAIVLVPKTYGLSLPVLALFDWWLYKRTQEVVTCYKCGTEFRNFPIPERIKGFMHHIGLKYDKYR